MPLAESGNISTIIKDAPRPSVDAIKNWIYRSVFLNPNDKKAPLIKNRQDIKLATILIIHPIYSYSINIIIPIINDIIENISVAPEAQSLAILASGFLSIVTKSTVASRALLINSQPNTKPKHIIIIHHSICVILNIIPNMHVIIIAVIIIIKLCSYFMAYFIPFKAFIKLFIYLSKASPLLFLIVVFIWHFLF